MGQYGQPAPKPKVAENARDAKRQKQQRWLVVRRLVLARDRHRCRVCHTQQCVDVHHIRFRSVGREDSLRNCCALCRVCHSAIHGYRLALSGDADQKLTIEWL